MTRQRVPETDHGIVGATTVEAFDAFARTMRDKGYHHIEGFIQAGCSGGKALEIGPGPGYVGLEWLKACPKSSLTGLEISTDMIELAKKNAGSYGLQDRTDYIQGDCQSLPFTDSTFDCVFSNGSFHEWEYPERALKEIERVLKSGGSFCISDLRRDIGPLARWLGLKTARPCDMHAGFLSSLNASYTVTELHALCERAGIGSCSVSKGFMNLVLVGKKTAKQ